MGLVNTKYLQKYFYCVEEFVIDKEVNNLTLICLLLFIYCL